MNIHPSPNGEGFWFYDKICYNRIMLISQAQTLPVVPPGAVKYEKGGAAIPNDVVSLAAIPVLFSNILAVAVSLIGLLSFAMLISGGVKFLTSGGDQKAVEQAKGTITWAIFGLVLAILSFLILKYLGSFLGVPDITIFKWPT